MMISLTVTFSKLIKYLHQFNSSFNPASNLFREFNINEAEEQFIPLTGTKCISVHIKLVTQFSNTKFYFFNFHCNAILTFVKLFKNSS